MIAIMKAEKLKWKRTFIAKLLWLTPLVTLLISAVLMGGVYFQTGAYNWWYTMLLPGALTICCALVVEKDKKIKYHSILALPLDLKKDLARKNSIIKHMASFDYDYFLWGNHGWGQAIRS